MPGSEPEGGRGLVVDSSAGAVEALLGAQLGRLVERLPIGVVSVTRALTVEYLNPAGQAHLPDARIGAPLPDPWDGISLRSFAGELFGPAAPSKTVVKTSSRQLLELDGIAGDSAENALLLLQDVTERERRRRAEREFVANAAHELRTPIAAITSAVDVLQGGAKEVPADRDHFLAHLERESERLGRLVGSLLLLARVQIGDRLPEPQVVEVRPLLEEVAARLEPRDGVAVDVRCEPGVAMFADPDLLQQAVWNVAANAAIHTVGGEICLSGSDLGRVAEIEVRDTGPGMSEEERGHVFDRFFRAPGSVGSGFGLGLPIAREVARALGGTLELHSAQGVGTRLRLRLPSARVVA